MSTTIQRTPKSGRQSLFFHDLATPVSSRKSGGKFATPGQAAAVSALWRENFANSDLPPPPMFTLEDRSDLSPESGIPDYPVSPGVGSDPRTPLSSFGREFSTPKSKSGPSTSYATTMGKQQQQSQQTPVASLSWWSPSKSGGSTEQEDKGKGSPVEGVVQPGALITLPPPREVARPEMKKNSVPIGSLDEEEWVTVYGFSPIDTNLVLREFEKCGVILKHVPGPRDANWMHILYQNRADALKALSKNGMQINGVLIIGVKPVDPMQRQALNERINNLGFMTLPPAPSNRISESNLSRASPYPYYLQNGSASKQAGGTVAAPSKSLVSKVVDLMFGV
ncbi:nuclear pore complex protein NUP35 [Coffea arabica]|uniref:Nuclear pore complex protein NUP35 n=1 Tax=Coffea arabica TaxID=13443 RepID=A0A6P6XIL1_COFAR|nr:nuclear pore complex protein NUP35 [Coffea arabica]XP_027126771.1 nuclear pore complex protein NUP35 [Coffea arabica]